MESKSKLIYLSVGKPAPEKALIQLPYVREPLTIKKALQKYPILYEEFDGTEGNATTLLYYFEWDKSKKLYQPKNRKAKDELNEILNLKYNPINTYVLLPHIFDPITIEKALKDCPVLSADFGEKFREAPRDYTCHFTWNKDEKYFEPKDEEAEEKLLALLGVEIGEFKTGGGDEEEIEVDSRGKVKEKTKGDTKEKTKGDVKKGAKASAGAGEDTVEDIDNFIEFAREDAVELTEEQKTEFQNHIVDIRTGLTQIGMGK